MKLEITLAQREMSGGGVRRVSLMREVSFRPHSPPGWHSYALVPGQEAKIEEEETIQKLRDGFVPRALARLFLLDTERSQNLKLGQEEMVEGVSRILGLWSYGELESSLRHVLYRNIPREYHATTAAEATAWLAELSGSVVRAEGQLQAKAKEAEALEAELAERKSELEQVEEELKQLGGAAPEEVKAARKEREELAAKIAELQGKLGDAWEVAIPVGLLGKFGQEFYRDLLEEEKRRDWESSKAGVEPKLPQLQEAVFDGAEPQFALWPETKAYYSGRLAQAFESLLLSPPAGITPGKPYLAKSKEESQQIRGLLVSGHAEWKTLPGLCAELKRVRQELRQSDERLEALQSNREALKRSNELHARRGEAGARIEQLQGRLKELAGERERLDEGAGRAQSARKRSSGSRWSRPRRARAWRRWRAATGKWPGRSRASRRFGAPRRGLAGHGRAVGRDHRAGAGVYAGWSLMRAGTVSWCGGTAGAWPGRRPTRRRASGRCGCWPSMKRCASWRTWCRRCWWIRRWRGWMRRCARACCSGSI